MVKKKKRAEKEYFHQSGKQALIPNNYSGYLKSRPSWAFSLCDETHERWSLSLCSSLYSDAIRKLRSYEGMSWGEIQSASGGRSHGTNCHFVPISGMCKEAQKRAAELNLDVDELFSLRLDGKKRLYGILEAGVFFVLWYDPSHEIFPVEK